MSRALTLLLTCALSRDPLTAQAFCVQLPAPAALALANTASHFAAEALEPRLLNHPMSPSKGARQSKFSPDPFTSASFGLFILVAHAAGDADRVSRPICRVSYRPSQSAASRSTLILQHRPAPGSPDRMDPSCSGGLWKLPCARMNGLRPTSSAPTATIPPVNARHEEVVSPPAKAPVLTAVPLPWRRLSVSIGNRSPSGQSSALAWALFHWTRFRSIGRLLSLQTIRARSDKNRSPFG